MNQPDQFVCPVIDFQPKKVTKLPDPFCWIQTEIIIIQKKEVIMHRKAYRKYSSMDDAPILE